jgi:hypothetical protein
VDVLKLFIVSVKSAYQRSNGYNSMNDIVHMVDTCPINTAGRPLDMDEIQLRTTWIYAVALLLKHIDYQIQSQVANTTDTRQTITDKPDDMALNVQTIYGPMLDVIVELQKSGDRLNTNEFMQRHRHLLPETIFDEDAQFAISSQTIKVLYYTLIVVEEESLANDNDSISDLARPHIPLGDSI